MLEYQPDFLYNAIRKTKKKLPINENVLSPKGGQSWI